MSGEQFISGTTHTDNVDTIFGSRSFGLLLKIGKLIHDGFTNEWIVAVYSNVDGFGIQYTQTAFRKGWFRGAKKGVGEMGGDIHADKISQ